MEKVGKSSDSGSFGPVVERVITPSASRAFSSTSNAVLPYLAKGSTNCVLLDLDTGRWASNAVYRPDVTEWREWMSGEGMDMLALGRTVPQTMVCFDLGLAPVENREWETITAADVLNYWPLVTTVARHQEQLWVDSNATNTYLFRTREGGRGMLQILGNSTNPAGVNIRYKLAQTASGPNAPALQSAFEYRTELVAKGALTQVVTATGALNPLPNDPGKWQINALVTEADIVRVAVAQAVAFTHDGLPDRTFHGKVVQIGTKAVTVQNVVCYDTIIEVTSAESTFKPGMTANLRIIVAQREDVLTIPNAALRFRLPGGGAGIAKSKSERIVYLIRDEGSGQPQLVGIKTGISDGSLTEVTEGLKAGDRVITGFRPMTSNSAEEAAPLKLQQAQADLVEAKARHDAGLASLSELQTAQLARDLAEAELSGDTAAILRAKLRFAQEQLLLAEARFKAGLATQAEFGKAQAARDAAQAEFDMTGSQTNRDLYSGVTGHAYFCQGKPRAGLEGWEQGWKVEGDCLVNTGEVARISTKTRFGKGDLVVNASLSLDELKGTAACFTFGDGCAFEFDPTDQRFVVTGLPLVRSGLALPASVITAGKQFSFVAEHRGDQIDFFIDDKLVQTVRYGGEMGSVGFAPKKGVMRLRSFGASQMWPWPDGSPAQTNASRTFPLRHILASAMAECP